MHEDITAFPFHEQIQPFAVHMCGISYCDGTYRIFRPNSPIWCCEYIIRGKGTVHLDDITFIAKAGDIYILPAGRKHFYYSDADDPWEKIWFNINGNLIDALTESYRIKHMYHVEGLNLHPIFTEFLETAKKSDSPQEAALLCSRVFMNFVQELSVHAQNYIQPKQLCLAEQLKKKLDNTTDFSLSFDALVKELYCSKSHIIRVFKTKYGITPYHYFLGKKIRTANMMLKNTGMSITEIATFLGFRDCHYFSNFFKKNTGVSPQEYRNQHIFGESDVSTER